MIEVMLMMMMMMVEVRMMMIMMMMLSLNVGYRVVAEDISADYLGLSIVWTKIR